MVVDENGSLINGAVSCICVLMKWGEKQQGYSRTQNMSHNDDTSDLLSYFRQHSLTLQSETMNTIVKDQTGHSTVNQNRLNVSRCKHLIDLKT